MNLQEKINSYDWKDLYKEAYGSNLPIEKEVYKYEVNGKKYKSQQEIADEYKVDRSTVSGWICHSSKRPRGMSCYKLLKE